MSSGSNSSASGNESSGSSLSYYFEENSSDFRTHYPVGNSDYSSDGNGSLGSYGLWSDHYENASTDSGRTESTASTNSNWSNNSGSSATSYGSASTWGSTIGRGSESGYDGDTESICN